MNSGRLPVNWFDVVLLLVLGLGLRQGRRAGLSVELIGMLQWVAIVFGCAFMYEPLGRLLAQSGSVSRLYSYLFAYVASGLVVAGLFLAIKGVLGDKLVGTDFFGGSEFYLGMVAGGVRFTCVLVVGLALLNARAYTAAEVKAHLRYQNDVYGSSFFPTLHSVQAQVFERSLAGSWIKKRFPSLLIQSTAPDVSQPKQKEFVLP